MGDILVGRWREISGAQRSQDYTSRKFYNLQHPVRWGDGQAAKVNIIYTAEVKQGRSSSIGAKMYISINQSINLYA